MFSMYAECSPILTIKCIHELCFDSFQRKDVCNYFVITPNLKISNICNDTSLSDATIAVDFHKFVGLAKMLEQMLSCFPKMHDVLQLSRRIQFPSSGFTKSFFIVWTDISAFSQDGTFLSSCQLTWHITKFFSSPIPLCMINLNVVSTIL